MAGRVDRSHVFTVLRSLLPVTPAVSETETANPDAVQLWYSSVDESNPAYPVVRGRINPHTFRNVQYDTYQREHLTSRKKKEGMKVGFRSGSKFPDVDFANRGVEWRVVNDQSLATRGNVIEIVGPTWCVDGRQRISNALELMDEADVEPTLGCAVMFNSTKEIETDLFEVLNQDHTQVASQVMLRNRKDENRGVGLVHDLCEDSEFPLQDRICWKQNASKADLMTGTALAKSVCWLHEKKGRIATKNTREIVATLGRLHEQFGEEGLKDNVLAFYNFIGRTWGLRNIPERPKPKPTQVMSAFVPTVARLLAADERHWDGNDLRIDPRVASRLVQFPMDDDYVRVTANSGVKPSTELLGTLRQHISGRDVRRRLAE